MKITIKNESKPSEIKYPCLMISKSNRVVLFTENRKGTVLAGGDYGDTIGKHSDIWFEESFTPFTGTIELSND